MKTAAFAAVFLHCPYLIHVLHNVFRKKNKAPRFRAGLCDLSVRNFVRDISENLYTIPCAIIAVATLMKPAMFAPAT